MPLYGLVSKRGKVIESTVRDSVEDAQVAAFDYLYGKPWTKPYWKKWDAFIRARQKRGWYVEKIETSLGPMYDRGAFDYPAEENEDG